MDTSPAQAAALAQVYGWDAAGLLVSVLMILGYYLRLRARLRRDPSWSVHIANEIARRLWVLSVMSDSRKDVMAVQTLRNFLMFGILMVSTVTLLLIGTLTLSSLHIAKVLLLLADFLVAFFSFVLSIRLANQVLFMVNVPEADRGAHPALAPERVAERLNRAGRLMAIGTRSLFFAIPLVFWLFGPSFLVLSTAGLVLVLDRIDRQQGGL